MGADFEFNPGPVLREPVQRADQVSRLRQVDPPVELAFVAEAIRELRAALNGGLPLIGFAGAPFTLAAFLIQGASPMSNLGPTIAFARQQPAAFTGLMARLTDLTAAYLRFQIEAGAHIVQLFESAGDQIPPPEYERYAHPSHQRIIAALPSQVPSILFVKGSPRPDLMLESGAAVISVGGQESLGALLRRSGGRVAVQGNVSNQILAQGTAQDVEAAVLACISDSGGRGHILNLDHGLLPETPFENVMRFVGAARRIALEPVARA